MIVGDTVYTPAHILHIEEIVDVVVRFRITDRRTGITDDAFFTTNHIEVLLCNGEAFINHDPF